MDHPAKISVIIPCYNQEKYIAEAIESVLKQTLPPYEIIVVNDGSTDASEEIIKTFAKSESQVHYFYQDNSGVSRARNTGIEAATGEFLLFLDGDDTLNPEALERMVSVFQDDPATGLVYCEAQTYGKSQEISNMAEHFTLEELLQGNKIFVTSMVRRDDLGDNIRFDDAVSKAHEDWEFWIQFVAAHPESRRVKIKYPAFNYRQSETSKMKGLQQNGNHAMHTYHYVYLKHKHLYDIYFPPYVVLLNRMKFYEKKLQGIYNHRLYKMADRVISLFKKQ